jgi:hypothetical protein
MLERVVGTVIERVLYPGEILGSPEIIFAQIIFKKLFGSQPPIISVV